MVEFIIIFKYIFLVNINCYVLEIVLVVEDKTVNKINVYCYDCKVYMKGGKRYRINYIVYWEVI